MKQVRMINHFRKKSHSKSSKSLSYGDNNDKMKVYEGFRQCQLHKLIGPPSQEG